MLVGVQDVRAFGPDMAPESLYEEARRHPVSAA
jgi:hypothetical protein